MIRRLLHNSLFQAVSICLFWLACELVVHLIKIPLSGGVLGLGFVLFLLITKRLQLESIKSGAKLLLKDMLLFFIPAVLAVLEHHEFFGILGLKILFVIVLSTITVMLVTAIIVDYFFHWRMEHAQSHSS